jgi:hypothetical protein
VTDYRYRLTRETGLLAGRGRAVVVMLNPSTADELQDDPTIRRLRGFAMREGWAGFDVVNLFAARATQPSELWRMAEAGEDIVGPDNDRCINNAVVTADVAVAAWGCLSTSPRASARLFDVLRLRVSSVVRWRCLGVTAFGHPRHPLYVRGDAPLLPWAATEFLSSRGQA